MDVLVEFCRTGRLGPITTGLNAVEVEALIGPATSTRDVHGEPNHQHFRFGDLLLVLTGNYEETRDRSRLTVEAIRVEFDSSPLDLPKPIEDALTYDWSVPRLQDVLARLHTSGVRVETGGEIDSPGAGLVRLFTVGDSDVTLAAVDDTAWYVEFTEVRGS